MTDADGNFHISLEGVYGFNKSLSRGRVKCTFSIRQRVIDRSTGLSCIPFMTEIANFFQCRINYGSSNIMIFFAGANKKHHITKLYFDKYCLMTSKQLNYLCFSLRLDYLGKSLTDKEVIEIQN